jgi:hypothetical protein
MKPNRVYLALFIGLMLLCALRPVLMAKPNAGHASQLQTEQNWAFAKWNVQNKSLYKLPASALEQQFSANFPGQIARFTDGNTIWVIRHTLKPTRMLHSALDCYKGLGYKVTQPRVLEDNNQQRWRCFNASKGQSLQVCERIFDNQNQHWTDVSAWYWESLMKHDNAQWWAITQVTPLE